MAALPQRPACEGPGRPQPGHSPARGTGQMSAQAHPSVRTQPDSSLEFPWGSLRSEVPR